MSSDSSFDVEEELNVQGLDFDELAKDVIKQCAAIPGHAFGNSEKNFQAELENAKGGKMEDTTDKNDDGKRKMIAATTNMDTSDDMNVSAKNVKRIIKQEDTDEKGKEVKQMGKAVDEVGKRMMGGDEVEKGVVYDEDHEKDESIFHDMDRYTAAHTSGATHGLYASTDDEFDLGEDLSKILGSEMSEEEKNEIIEELIIAEKLIAQTNEASNEKTKKDGENLAIDDGMKVEVARTVFASTSKCLTAVASGVSKELQTADGNCKTKDAVADYTSEAAYTSEDEMSGGVDDAGGNVNEKMMGSASRGCKMRHAIPGTSGAGADAGNSGIGNHGPAEATASCSYVSTVEYQNTEEYMVDFRVNLVKAMATNKEYQRHLVKIGRDHYVQICYLDPNVDDPFWYGLCDYWHVNSETYHSKYGQLCKKCHDMKRETDEEYDWKPIFLHTICHKIFYENKSKKTVCDLCHAIAEFIKEAIQCLDCGHYYVDYGPPEHEALVLGNNPNLCLAHHLQKPNERAAGTSTQSQKKRVTSQQAGTGSTGTTPKPKRKTVGGSSGTRKLYKKGRAKDQEADEIDLPRMVLRSSKRPPQSPHEQDITKNEQPKDAQDASLMVHQDEPEVEAVQDGPVREVARLHDRGVGGLPVLGERNEPEVEVAHRRLPPAQDVPVADEHGNPEMEIAQYIQGIRTEFKLPQCLQISLQEDEE